MTAFSRVEPEAYVWYLSLWGIQGSPVVGPELVKLIKLETYVLD